MRPKFRSFSSASNSNTDTSSHVLMWLLVTVAAVLLVGFTAVVEGISQRGDMRRDQQRVTGSLLLPEEMQMPAAEILRLVSVTGDSISSN